MPDIVLFHEFAEAICQHFGTDLKAMKPRLRTLCSFPVRGKFVNVKQTAGLFITSRRMLVLTPEEAREIAEFLRCGDGFVIPIYVEPKPKPVKRPDGNLPDDKERDVIAVYAQKAVELKRAGRLPYFSALAIKTVMGLPAHRAQQVADKINGRTTGVK